MEGVVAALSTYGIAGLMAAVAIWIAVKKDRQADVLWGALVRTEKEWAERYHTLAAELNETLKEIVDTDDDDGEA